GSARRRNARRSRWGAHATICGRRSQSCGGARPIWQKRSGSVTPEASVGRSGLTRSSGRKKPIGLLDSMKRLGRQCGIVQGPLDGGWGGEKHLDYEYRLWMPDGEIKNIHVRARRQADETGEAELVGALMDVTPTKRAQEALQAAQTALAHVTRV